MWFLILIFVFEAKNKMWVWVEREVAKICEELGEGKNMIKMAVENATVTWHMCLWCSSSKAL